MPGRHAAEYAKSKQTITPPNQPQIEAEKTRVLAPLKNNPAAGVSWKELNHAISKTMQNYCAEVRCDELLNSGIEQLRRYQNEIVPAAYAANPHELTRLLEVFDILTVAEIILQASLERKQTCKKLEFFRSDDNGQPQRPFIVIRHDGEKLLSREVPLNYAGDIKENYEKQNPRYQMEMEMQNG